MTSMPPLTYRLSAGTVLQRRYEIHEAIAEGGFATVYRGRQLNIDRPVAVKLLLPNGDEETQRIIEEKFLIEATSSAEIQHPNVVTVYDYGLTDDERRQPFIAMELLEGHNLEQGLRRHGPIEPQRAFRLLLPCLEALAEAHRLGIVHRDLKPANLFIVHPGTVRETLKVLDFGVARVRAIHATSSTGNGQILGSPRYLAPEYLTQRIVTPTLDVYQMGLVLVEMLTGTPVVDTKNPYHCIWFHSNGELQVPTDLMTGPLGPVLMGALDSDYTSRFQHIGALREALLALDPATISAPGPTRERLADFGDRIPSAAVQEDDEPTDSFSAASLQAGLNERGEAFSDPTVPFDMRGHVEELQEALARHKPRFKGSVSINQRAAAPAPAPAPELDEPPWAQDGMDSAATTEWNAARLKNAGLRSPTPKPMAVSINLPPRGPLPSPGPTSIAPAMAPYSPPRTVEGTSVGGWSPRSPLFLTTVMISGVLLFVSVMVCAVGALFVNLEPAPPQAAPTAESFAEVPPLAPDEADVPAKTTEASVKTPTPTPSRGVSVTFSTEPSGAIIKEFDAVLGQTPHVLKFQSSQGESRRIQVELEGYRRTFVDISAQDAPSMTIKLTPEVQPADKKPVKGKGKPAKGKAKGEKPVMDKW